MRPQESSVRALKSHILLPNILLVVKVPPHNNYTETVFFLHQDSDTSMMKTEGSCHITEIPEYVNVSSLAEGYKTHDRMRVTKSNTETSYLIKNRQARYGAQKRAAELHPEAEYLCKDSPVVKTNDVYVTEEDWEKFNNGEVITIGNEKNTRQSGNCDLKWSVTKEGPRACGYGWQNPAGGGLSFHQVSGLSLNVTCAIPNENSNNLNVHCDGYEKAFCQCKKIQSKRTLVRCYFKGRAAIQSKINIGGRRTNLIQTMNYDENDVGDAVIISSPAYGGYEATDVVMHAHKDGWWHEGVYSGTLQNNKLLKIGDVCHIATLPDDIFPVDIATGIYEIKEGNDVTTEEDEETQQEILIPAGILTTDENNDLHPLIKDKCKDSSTEKFVPPTPSQADILKNGGVIVLDDDEDFGIAAMLSDQGSGIWRIPSNGNGAKLWIKQIVSPVKTASCCVSESCTSFDLFCDCDQIDGQNYDECYSKARVAKQLKEFNGSS